MRQFFLTFLAAYPGFHELDERYMDGCIDLLLCNQNN